jgi:NAD(P)-dependent dehydrogenase (short-subunit alcohol dehydrogenase family)
MSARLAILTGANGGVGRACAKKFADEGWSLVLVDIDASVVETAKQIAAAPGQVIVGIAADITQEAEVEKVVAAVKATGVAPRFLGLVAGVNQSASAVEDFDMAVWDRIMSINLRANVLMMRALIPSMKATGKASIATVSSFWGRAGHGYFSAYCASKAALISLTQSAAAELAPEIRVNSLAPGNIGTPMHYNALRDEATKRGISEKEMRDIEWAKIPMGKPADPAEMASALHFLATDDSSYMTGATLDVNGGCGFY